MDTGQMIAVVASSVVLPVLGSLTRLSGCLVMPLAVILSVVIGHLAILVRYPDFHFGPVYSVAIGMYLTISSLIVLVTFAGIRMAQKKRRVGRDGD